MDLKGLAMVAQWYIIVVFEILVLVTMTSNHRTENLEIVKQLYCLEYQLLIDVQAGQSICVLN